MTIQEARFRKPWNIGTTVPSKEDVMRALSERDYTLITYPEGTFDVSPMPSTERRHELVVFQNGNGTLRRIRREGGASPTATTPLGNEISLRGDTHPLQEGVLPMIIASNMPGSRNSVGVYSVLMHTPGHSPTQMSQELVTATSPVEASGPQVRRVQPRKASRRRDRKRR